MRAYARPVTTTRLSDPEGRDRTPCDPRTVEPEPPHGEPARWTSLLWRIGAAVRAAHSSSVPF